MVPYTVRTRDGAADLSVHDERVHADKQTLAGAKSPRAFSGRDAEYGNSEPWGEEVSPDPPTWLYQSMPNGLTRQAKFFTEIRLLQRPIKVRLLSAPASLGAPPSMGSAKSNGNGLPALPSAGNAATNIIGTA